MNQYQKTAIFIVRLAGSVISMFGSMGLLYIAFFGMSAPSHGHDRVVGSFVWVLVGALLVIFAKPLGLFLGRGLD